MGTGTPTTVAYILVATLGVPVMQDLGLPLVASHLFVFYFAVISMITPPVAIAAFAAGEIAQEDPIKVGFTSMKIAAILYVIPFIFLFDPTMLLIGNFGQILFRFASILCGIVFVSGGLTRWFFRKLKRYESVLLIAIGALGLIPLTIINTFTIALLIGTLTIRFIKRKMIRVGA
jgi:TRAP-type uncharacterized transport system fused permease subunit